MNSLIPLKIHGARMERALTDDMLATDVAEYLVRAGLPFRDAHHKAGEVVRMGRSEYLFDALPSLTGFSAIVITAEENKCGMSTLTLAQLQTISPLFAADMAQNPKWWNFERSVESRAVDGGTSRSSVMAQCGELRTWLGGAAA